MNLSEAKSTLAGYLTGKQVSREALRQAWQAIQDDPAYVQYLLEELGIEGWEGNDCDVFLARAAEFSEMTAQERAREMPELVAHVESCASCLHALWSIKPLWTEPTVEVEGKTTRARRALTENLSLTVSQSGALRSRGPTPPAVFVEIHGAAASVSVDQAANAEFEEQAGAELAAVARRRLEWRLESEGGEWTIQLVIRGLPDGRVTVAPHIESRPPDALPPVRLEIRQLPGNSPYQAGPLADFQAEPLVLPPGSWTLRLQAAGLDGIRIWDIPLVLDTEADNGSPESI